MRRLALALGSLGKASARAVALCPLLCLGSCEQGPLVLDCLPGLTWDIEEQRCVGWDTGSPEDEPEAALPVVESLDAPQLLRRMSLDLRGTLPGTDELDAVEADPDAIDELRASYLEDPAFEERLVVLLNEEWQTLVDDFVIQAGEAGFADEDEFLYERSVGEEPLRLMARVAAEDRPWTDILTVDWTMANPALASFWPLELEEGEEAWRKARYLDSRPAAGVLSANGLWWRYDTNDSNANRGRAAAMSRLLVCADFHGRPVSFTEVDLSDGAQEASLADPACTGCHAGLDPIASALFGFWWVERHSLVEVSWYHAEREPLGESVLGVTPAWFGQPADSLTALAVRIGSDDRFSRCAAQTMAGLLLRRPMETDDHATITALDERFVEEELRLKALVVAVTDTPEYRAGGLTDDADAVDSARIATRRVLVASQLATSIEDLTGFVWEEGGTSMLHEDEVGMRVLAGGLDGRYIQRVASMPTLTWAITVRRLAELAADHVVENELIGDGEARMLGELELEDQPGDPAFEAVLEETWWRMHGERLDEETRASLHALWSAVAEDEGVEAAWRATLTALLRDPAWLEY